MGIGSERVPAPDPRRQGTSEARKIWIRIGLVLLQLVEILVRAGVFWVTVQTHRFVHEAVSASIPVDWVYPRKLLLGAPFCGICGGLYRLAL